MGQTWPWPPPQDIRDGQGSVQLCQKTRVVKSLAHCFGGVKLRACRTIIASLARQYVDEVKTSTQLAPVSFRARREGGEQAQVFLPKMQRVDVGVQIKGALAG